MGEISKEALEEPKREPFVKCPTNTQQLFQTLGGIFSHLLDKSKCFEMNKMLPLQEKQPEMRISLLKIKKLWNEIAKDLLRIFCGFVHHEFSHKHVILADLISRLEKRKIFQN